MVFVRRMRWLWRAKLDKVLPDSYHCLMYEPHKFMNRAVEISVGSLSPTINWSTLKLEQFDLPRSASNDVSLRSCGRSMTLLAAGRGQSMSTGVLLSLSFRDVWLVTGTNEIERSNPFTERYQRMDLRAAAECCRCRLWNSEAVASNTDSQLAGQYLREPTLRWRGCSI